jgi:hypothetical protein
MIDLKSLSNYELDILPPLIEKEIEFRKHGKSLVYYYQIDNDIYWFKELQDCIDKFRSESTDSIFSSEFAVKIGKYMVPGDKYSKLGDSGECYSSFDF